jgi:hypothetical protein
MSARVIPFPAKPTAPPVAEGELATAQRNWLAEEEAASGRWSDSVLIAQLFGADPYEREAILAAIGTKARPSTRPAQ